MDFTCFNRFPVLLSSVNDQFIGGYKGIEVVGADVSFGRTIRTGTGGDLPQSSCACAYVQPFLMYTRQYMRCPSGSCSCADSLGGTTDCLYRIGAFYCEIQVGTTTERITTITLNAEGKHVKIVNIFIVFYRPGISSLKKLFAIFILQRALLLENLKVNGKL